MQSARVALFTRAWIEIAYPLIVSSFGHVALFTRAWIEIEKRIDSVLKVSVALFTRAWIEICEINGSYRQHLRRPLHEGVD